MTTLTTKLTIATTAASAASFAVITPAMANDGRGMMAPAPALADVLRIGATGATVVAGIVLLSKAAAAYRRSQWRRRWSQRRSAETVFVSSVRWPAGGISGRSVVRPTAAITAHRATSL